MNHMRKPDTYSRVETRVYKNAIVKVYIPDLTDEERERRYKIIHDAAAALLLSAEKAKREKEKDGQPA